MVFRNETVGKFDFYNCLTILPPIRFKSSVHFRRSTYVDIAGWSMHWRAKKRWR